MKATIAVIFLSLFASVYCHGTHGFSHRRRVSNDKNFYQIIPNEEEKADSEYSIVDDQNLSPVYSLTADNDVQQETNNDLLRFRSKVDRYDKDYDGKRSWRCKHNEDSENSKTASPRKYGYNKRYWKSKFRNNRTLASSMSASSLESAEGEPELTDFLES